MKKDLSLFLVFCAILITLAFFWLFTPPKKEANFSAEIKGELFSLEIANQPEQWVQGLSGQQSMADNQGLLFIFPDYKQRSFWMKDMLFAIDILWLKDNEVVGFAKNVPPPPLGTSDSDLESYISPLPINMVLEVVAGTVDRLDIEKGDIISLK